MTQLEMLIRHFEKGQEISQREALNLYGISYLPARINDLKNLGYEITSRTEKGKNRFGNDVYFSVYSMKVKA